MNWCSLSVVSLFAVSALAASPQTHSNHQKYREKPGSFSRGRSGNATVTAQAVIGHDGTTEIRLTTAPDDTSPAPGRISKVQVKARDSRGRVILNDERRFTANSGQVTLRYEHLFLGQVLELTVHVRDIDSSEDIVTLSETIKRRPDLAVAMIQGARWSPAGGVLSLTAYVEERNLEVGARADCVLRVDGTEVDRAHAVWVDAGSTGGGVAFAFRLETIGTHVVKISLENLGTADDDPSNNSATASISVTDPRLVFNYSTELVDFVQYFSHQSFDAWSIYPGDSGRAPDAHYERTESGSWQQRVAYGDLGMAVSYPVRLEFADSTDGQAISNIAVTVAEPAVTVTWQEDNGGSTTCQITGRFGEFPGVFIELQTCHFADATGVPLRSWTTFLSQQQSGEIVYLSEGRGRLFLQGSPNGDSWTDSGSNSQNFRIPIGATYNVTIAIDDGSRRVGSLEVLLSPDNQIGSYPQTCNSDPWGFAPEAAWHCFSWEYVFLRNVGNAAGADRP